MNQSLGVNSGQRLRCFISWKRVASARRELLAVALMLHHLRPSLPPSKKQKKSGSKTKRVLISTFILGIRHSVCWVQTDTSADTWAPSCNGRMVPGTWKRERYAVFLSVSKLKRRKTQTGEIGGYNRKG